MQLAVYIGVAFTLKIYYQDIQEENCKKGLAIDNPL